MDALPENLPLLVGTKLRDYQAVCLEKAFKGEFQTTAAQMIAFSKAGYKIKIWFNEEVEIKTINRVVKREKLEWGMRREYSNRKMVKVHAFSYIGYLYGWQYENDTVLGYGLTRRTHRAGILPSLDKIVKWEPIPIK